MPRLSMPFLTLPLLSVVLVGAFPVAALAHVDSCLWTSSYMTPDQGERELMTQSFWGAGSGYQKHAIELEYGISNFLSLASYLIFKRDNAGENVHAEAVKLEARHRLLEEGMLPVDIGTYFEFERPFDFTAPNEMEGKLILSKTLGLWTLCVNGVLKQSLDNASPRYGSTAGLSFALSPNLSLNLEAQMGSTAGGTYVGPTVSWFSGPLRCGLGGLIGAAPGSEPFFLSCRLGTEF